VRQIQVEFQRFYSSRCQHLLFLQVWNLARVLSVTRFEEEDNSRYHKPVHSLQLIDLSSV